VPKVVTRIYDPLRHETFEMLGIDAISPTVLGANLCLEIIDPGSADSHKYDPIRRIESGG
jgi:Trk K+ transport system NAD-binding subunit